MTDQQPGDPAAGESERPDPTRTDQPAPDAVTKNVPERWSGSAAVPPPTPKKPRWGRRQPQPEVPTAPVDPWARSEDWSTTPAVDPWADHDTPIDVMEPFPEAMPPTRIDAPIPPARADRPLPPTRIDAPPPPTRADAPPTPTRVDAPADPAPPAAAATPNTPAEGKRRGWFRKRPAAAPPAAEAPGGPPPAWSPPGASNLPAAYAQRARPLPPPPPAKGRKQRPAPPPAWPPPQAGPRRSPPPPPRRKRRWGRRLSVFTLLSALCCCGVPGYFLWPAAQQYPVSAALPPTVADLDLREDNASRQAVERLADQVGGLSLVSGDVFAGMYADGDGKRVTVFGSTGLRLTPERDVEAELEHLTTEYKIKKVQTFDLGETGVHERCGVGRSSGDTVVVCAWADHGSLATVLLTRRSIAESARLTGAFRDALLDPQIGRNAQLSSG